ncbi:DUF1080 domain-containing protein [Roseibacillus persicicus]|uniref:3-keto-disaccharide hydrolase n=1 Tax=Roseibacillus persicicus TaxID=454148 RepID=UPI00398B2E3D
MKSIILLFGLSVGILSAEPVVTPKIDGTGPGWVDLTSEDFVNINCAEDTWSWKGNSVSCTGQPVGVIATKENYTNFELIVEWCHRKPAGNSGVFVWGIPSILTAMKEGEDKRALPAGIEVQVLDLDYKTNYEKDGKVADWFTCHGDVFPVAEAKLTPFAPLSPNKNRSFPTAETTKGHGEWNHYYIRCINGEVRLWVNGVEVSGGNQAEPATGQICLESEGSPIDFRNLKIRVLP